LPSDWEVLTDDDGEVVGVVCEQCITPEEQQAMDVEMMALEGFAAGKRVTIGECPLCAATDVPGTISRIGNPAIGEGQYFVDTVKHDDDGAPPQWHQVGNFMCDESQLTAGWM
jgi:hypothetical protein